MNKKNQIIIGTALAALVIILGVVFIVININGNNMAETSETAVVTAIVTDEAGQTYVVYETAAATDPVTGNPVTPVNHVNTTDADTSTAQAQAQTGSGTTEEAAVVTETVIDAATGEVVTVTVAANDAASAAVAPASQVEVGEGDEIIIYDASTDSTTSPTSSGSGFGNTTQTEATTTTTQPATNPVTGDDGVIELPFAPD